MPTAFHIVIHIFMRHKYKAMTLYIFFTDLSNNETNCNNEQYARNKRIAYFHYNFQEEFYQYRELSKFAQYIYIFII